MQLPEELYQAIEKEAAIQHTTADALVVSWVSEKLGATKMVEVSTVLEQEAAAFAAMKNELLEQHAGKFVAVYEEQVVAVGDSRIDVVKAVYNEFGEVPVYVEQVTSEPMRPVRIPSLWKADPARRRF